MPCGTHEIIAVDLNVHLIMRMLGCHEGQTAVIHRMAEVTLGTAFFQPIAPPQGYSLVHHVAKNCGARNQATRKPVAMGHIVVMYLVLQLSCNVKRHDAIRRQCHWAAMRIRKFLHFFAPCQTYRL